jgi:hypothetical protein
MREHERRRNAVTIDDVEVIRKTIAEHETKLTSNETYLTT